MEIKEALTIVMELAGKNLVDVYPEDKDPTKQEAKRQHAALDTVADFVLKAIAEKEKKKKQ